MSSGQWRDEAAASLRAILTDALRHHGVRVVAVDATGPGALVTFFVDDDPHLLGTCVPWDGEVAGDAGSPAAWAHDVRMHLDPWVTYGTRRVDRGTYLEVSDDQLPHDRRFWHGRVRGDDEGRWLRRHGFDTTAALAARDRGALVGWWHASVDGNTGEPVVAHAAVVRVDATTACLEPLQVADLAPTTVALDLAFAAASAAARAGAARLSTRATVPGLALLGFAEVGGGEHVLDLALLAVDTQGWGRLVADAGRVPLPRQLVRGPGTGAQRLVRRLTTSTRTVIG